MLKGHSYVVGCSKYPDYPINIFETDEFWICIEGKIYGKTIEAINKETHALIRRIFETTKTSEEDKRVIADWLLKTDGDFVIYALNKKTKDFIIMNDVLGRLPFYYYNQNDEILASREIQLISYLIENEQHIDTKFDKMAIAQFLLFRHTLGNRTLLSDVYRLGPASLLRIHIDNFSIQVESIYRFNFERKEHENKSIKDNAGRLVSLFTEACKSRADDNSKNLVSLSGGLDSRAVAACLRKSNVPIYAVTSTDPNWRPVDGNNTEPEIAEQIAKLLNIKWENYGVMEVRAQDIIRMIKIKRGQIYLPYCYLLPFLEKVQHKYHTSRINFFTGDGANRFFGTYDIKARNLDHLISKIIQVRSFLPLREVASLVEIDEKEIVDELRNILSSYPEESLSQKAVHYLYFEFDNKFIFEAEDIIRFYFWTVTPFYSIPFFKYAINCPDKHKSKHRLKREFLINISTSIAEIKTSNWGCSILSRKYKIMQSLLILYFKYPLLRKIIKKLKDNQSYGYERDSKVIRCIEEQVKNCNVISNHLSLKAVNKIINNCTDYNHFGADNLFTITSVIEKTFCKNNVIERCYKE